MAKLGRLETDTASKVKALDNDLRLAIDKHEMEMKKTFGKLDNDM